MTTWLLQDIHSAIEQELDMNDWMIEHNLISAQNAINKHNVTLDELAKYTEEEAEEFAEMICLNKIETLRFKKAIKSIQPQTRGAIYCKEDEQNKINNKINNKLNENELIEDGDIDIDIIKRSQCNPMSPQHIVAVVVSQREQDVHDSITSKYNDINDNLSEIEENMKLLERVSKQNRMKMNNMRTEIINKINYKFDELIKESDYEISIKQNELNIYENELKQHQDELYNTKLTYNSYLVDEGMNVKQRKCKILAMNKEILSKDIDSNTIIPKVKISVNKDEILRYIDNIGIIRNYSCPKAPIFCIKNTTPCSAIVQFNNLTDSVDVTLEIAENYNFNDIEEEDDEEEEEDDIKLEWKQIEYIINEENEYNITKLKDNISYSLRGKYKNDYGFSKYSQIFTFKTRKIGLLIDASSGILGGNEKQILCDLLNERNFKYKKLKCIYSSIKNGFNVNLCHQQCQNKRNILFIIHTNTDNIFGAFTSTKWITDNNVDKKDLNSFIFLLKSSNNKYKPNCFDIICGQSMAVWYHSNYFCLIGTGYDISIYKTCNKLNGYTYIAKGNYSTPTKYYINADKKGFIVKNIEIFSCV